MIRIRPEQFPLGTIRNCMLVVQVLIKFSRKLIQTHVIIDLSSDFGISSTFNILELVAYKSPFNPDNLLVDLDEPILEPFFEDPTCHLYLLYLSDLQHNRLIAFRMIKSFPLEMVVADDI